MASPSDDPHRDQPVLAAGAPVGEASAAMILVHGRGANAADILGLSQVLDRPRVACFAPEAAGHVWYPRPFMSPVAANEPYLSSALGVLGRLFAELEKLGKPPARVVLLGFSQGACLASEYVARNPLRYGGLAALSGGLIGDRVEAGRYPGSLSGTPVFMGCSDVDPFIPLERVHESAAVMRTLGGTVVERSYAGAAHTIVEDEIVEVRKIIDAVLAA